MNIPPGKEPPLSRYEEVLVWKDMVLSRPSSDPIHRWARRRLVAQGLLDPDPPAELLERHRAERTAAALAEVS